MKDPRPSPKIKINTNSMKAKYRIDETLKQPLYALNNRFSRYQRRQKQYQQSNDIINKQSKLFDELRGNRTTIMDPPTKEDTQKFWKYSKDVAWLQEYKTSVNDIMKATYSEITTKEIKSATSEFSNWKSPGLDKLHNFWRNKLTTLHRKVAIAFGKLIVQPENCPDWLTTGQTTLIAKREPTRNPSNYRPITCLPVMYKILPSIVTSRMSHHINANKIMPNEQKINASNAYGTIDQLIINKMVMDNVKLKQLLMVESCEL